MATHFKTHTFRKEEVKRFCRCCCCVFFVWSAQNVHIHACTWYWVYFTINQAALNTPTKLRIVVGFLKIVYFSHSYTHIATFHFTKFHCTKITMVLQTSTYLCLVYHHQFFFASTCPYEKGNFLFKRNLNIDTRFSRGQKFDFSEIRNLMCFLCDAHGSHHHRTEQGIHLVVIILLNI